MGEAAPHKPQDLRHSVPFPGESILTSCANRPLPYPLYADGRGLLALEAPLTADSLSKNIFLTD